MKNDITNQLNKRVKQCLVHRYLYYVLGTPLIADDFYDKLERELRELTIANLEIASSVPFIRDVVDHPGSDLAESYPRHIEQLANSLLKYAGALNE